MRRIIFISIILYSCNSNSSKQNIVAKGVTQSSSEIKKSKIISDSTNTLENKVQTLELEYIVWGCACASWITFKDYAKYQDSGLSKHCIFIEPIDSSLDLPQNFFPDKHKIIVTGQFYVKEDYPRGTFETEENLDKAKVFRYTKLKVLPK